YGRSVRGAELRVHLPARPRHLLVAGMHGEEPETVQLARGVLERVDADAATCAIVLCANPDGIADGTRQNARGVDLNRNFPATTWRAGTTPSYPAGIDPAQRVSANRTNISSTGATPLSEPESTALAALIERLGPSLVLDLHAPLELVLTTPLVPEAVARELADAAGMEVTDDIGSPVPGALRDWLGDNGVPCVTYELEHAGLPALYARHLPGLVAFVTRTPAASRD
ncbi:MAG TPA: M14 family zinc carboxypeptidase, partial [Gaiellales bacterium]|nr:M14 family zinc carboxypeptidase [Gaiellales bacterium]